MKKESGEKRFVENDFFARQGYTFKARAKRGCPVDPPSMATGKSMLPPPPPTIAPGHTVSPTHPPVGLVGALGGLEPT